MSLPRVADERNGEASQEAHPIDPKVADTLQVPLTGTRAARYRKAAVRITSWPCLYDGMDRLESLRETVRRIRADVDVHEDDIPVLIARNLYLSGQAPYTLSELYGAMIGSKGQTRTPPQAPTQSAGDRAREILGPSILDRRPDVPLPPKESDEMVGIMANEVKEAAISWFIPKLVPYGYYTLVAGRRGVGKSTFFTGMAAKAKRTIWFCGEEQLDNLVLPRLKAHGISPGAVEFFTRDHKLSFPHCKDALMRRIQKTGTDLVIVDPLTAFLAHGVDCNINEQMQPLLQALDDVSTKTRCAMLVCLHPGKAANNTIRGASVFMTHPRIVLELVRDPGPPPKRMLTNPKNNLCGEQGGREILAVPNKAGIGVFAFGQAVDEKEEVFAAEVPDRLQRVVIQECMGWLAEALRDGPRARKEIVNAAKDEGFTMSTLDRAADRLQIDRKRGGTRNGEGGKWTLPGFVEPATPFEETPQKGG